MSTPSVSLELFEGPLDLLLHLVKRNELSIVDIPIARITDEYLAMLDQLPQLDLDGAGEYLVMAATLTYLKSRTLLPEDPVAGDEPEEDPRAQLVQQLLEYQRYREAALALGARPVLARDVFAPAGETAPGAEEQGEQMPLLREASVGDLLAALRAVLARHRPPAPHAVVRPGLSVGESMQRLLDRLGREGRLAFPALFAPTADRAEVIVTFLALLEMIRLKVVRALQVERFGPIEVELGAYPLAEAHEVVQALVVARRGGEVQHAGGAGNGGQ